MKKTELIAAMAQKACITQTQAKLALEAMVDNISTTIGLCDSVTLPGLGTFSTTFRTARIGRNPRTGEKVHIPARRTAKFKQSSTLKKVLNAV